MATSDEFKRHVKAGNLSEALKMALSEVIELKITTWVMPTTEDDLGDSSSNASQAKPGYRMMTRINIVDGDIDNEVGSQFLSSGPYSELREFHLNQVQKGREIINRNLQVLKDLFGTLAVSTSRRYDSVQTGVSQLNPPPPQSLINDVDPGLISDVDPALPTADALAPLVFDADDLDAEVPGAVDNPDADLITDPSNDLESIDPLVSISDITTPSEDALAPLVFDQDDAEFPTSVADLSIADRSLSDPMLDFSAMMPADESSTIAPDFGSDDLGSDLGSMDDFGDLGNLGSPVEPAISTDADPSSWMPDLPPDSATSDTNEFDLSFDPVAYDLGIEDSAGATYSGAGDLPNPNDFNVPNLDGDPLATTALPSTLPESSSLEPLSFGADDLDALLQADPLGSISAPADMSVSSFDPMGFDGGDEPTTMPPDAGIPPLADIPDMMLPDIGFPEEPDALTAMPDYQTDLAIDSSILQSPWDTPTPASNESLSPDLPPPAEFSLDELNDLFVSEELYPPEFPSQDPGAVASVSPEYGSGMSVEDTVNALFGDASLMETPAPLSPDHEPIDLDEAALNSLFGDVTTEIFAPSTGSEIPKSPNSSDDDNNPFADFPG
jgi:hypothetical protein